MKPTRRRFLSVGAAAVGAAACSRAPDSIEPTHLPPLPNGPPPAGGVPRRKLGSTGADVSVLGLGGFHIGRADSLDEATRIVGEAIDAGVNFFDNAWEYN